jgi:hypothetical protein
MECANTKSARPLYKERIMSRPGDYRGNDDATERAGADAQIKSTYRERPDLVRKILASTKPEDQSGIARIKRILGLG